MSQLLLVQLSDMHFGKHSRYAGADPTRLGHTVAENIERARTELKIPVLPSVVVVSGDLVEMAKPAEFTQAQAFLRAFHEKTALPRKAFVFVPGNHDLSWTDCKTIDLQREDEEFDDREWRKRIDDIKFQRFDRCVEGFYGDAWEKVARPLGHGAYLYIYPEHGLCVAALNSCERESHRSLDHLGMVGPEQAQAVMTALRSPECAPLLKCLVVHHHPDSTVPANVSAWRDWIKKNGNLDSDLIERYEHDLLGLDGAEHLRQIVKDCHVQLLLHGHHHAAKETPWNWDRMGQAHVISAGSFGLGKHELPQDQSNSLRLILLDTAERRLTAWSLIFDPNSHTIGTVGSGAYIPVLDQSQVYLHSLSLPSEWQGIEGTQVASSAAPAPDPSVEEFLTAYRTGFADAHFKWDLRGVGAVQTGGVSRPIETNLDDIYQPLRLAESYNVDVTTLGTALDPKALLTRAEPLLITAPAGGGKTTWMRWTFRRLLESEDSLPIMVVLRDVAKYWRESESRGSKRGLEHFIEEVTQERIERSSAGEMARWLQSGEGPTPVLLVDGWDELGDLGREFREKLGALMRKLSHVRVVVTSRPYGESRPSGADGFTQLYLQPLSLREIEAFASRFFQLCHGATDPNTRPPTVEFMAALRNAPEPAAMARTPLLLTMMLLVSRSSPLPDKRHELYDLCIRSLLSARPRQRESEGVQDLPNQWRPDDSDERLRAIAAIAFRLQDEAYRTRLRGAIVSTLSQLTELCPNSWNSEQRIGFILWLAGSSGVLTDRADETIVFTHLSFQEYLASWHLHATVEGDTLRVDTFKKRARSEQWWETLRLWAGRIDGQNPDRLLPVFTALGTEHWTGFWLLGAVLADGSGPTVLVTTWAKAVFDALRSQWPLGARGCAAAWANSRQDERRKIIADVIRTAAIEANWLQWTRLSEWARDASIEGTLEPPTGSAVDVLGYLLPDGTLGRLSIARGRVLTGGYGLWPGEPVSIALLQCWPGARRIVGMRLQALALLGGDRVDLRQCLETWYRGSFENPELCDSCVLEFAPSLFQAIRRVRGGNNASLQHPLLVDILSYVCRFLPITASNAGFHTRTAVQYSALINRERKRSNPAPGLSDCVDNVAAFLREVARSLTQKATTDLGITPSQVLYRNFAAIEMYSLGRSSARSFAARLNPAADAFELRLLAAACLVSFEPLQLTLDFAFALAEYPDSASPIWPALARHIARQSTLSDRKLLESAARNPESQPEPLSWGLKYIVRGDVILDDGTEITLDELCHELGLTPLPILEDMPSELKVEFRTSE